MYDTQHRQGTAEYGRHILKWARFYPRNSSRQLARVFIARPGMADIGSSDVIKSGSNTKAANLLAAYYSSVFDLPRQEVPRAKCTAAGGAENISEGPNESASRSDRYVVS